MENSRRIKTYKKNAALEVIFPEMQAMLGPVESGLLEKYEKPTKPILFIVGCARSGTTLLYQYLANSGLFGYPSNFISRFFYAPYVGIRLQQMLIDADRNGEIFQINSENIFISNLGKTFGPKQPHEFWYFWNRFFQFKELQQLSREELLSVDWPLFLKELHAMETAFGLPLLMKAMNMNWHINELAKRSNNIHFLFIKREVLYNAQSLLLARDKFFGNLEEWYSFKPENYYDLKKLLPWEQTVEQVISTNMAIEEQLKNLNESRYTILNYKDFCRKPADLLKNLHQKLNLQIGKKTLDNEGIKFENKQKLDKNVWNKLINYCLQKGA